MNSLLLDDLRPLEDFGFVGVVETSEAESFILISLNLDRVLQQLSPPTQFTEW